MRLALALYAPTGDANTPHCDLDLLYHDGRAHSVDKRLLMWLFPSPRRGAHSSGTSASAHLKTWTVRRGESRRARSRAGMAPWFRSKQAAQRRAGSADWD